MSVSPVVHPPSGNWRAQGIPKQSLADAIYYSARRHNVDVCMTLPAMATARAGVFAWQTTPISSVVDDATPIRGPTHQLQLCRQDADLPEQFMQLHSSPPQSPQSLQQSRFHQHQLEQTASERQRLEAEHLQQRQQLQLQHHHHHHQLPLTPSKLASNTSVWWTETCWS
jgi:hypothetical protein